MKNKTLRTNSMKLKKVIAASLAISVLFAFTGCGNSSSTDNTNTKQESSSTTETGSTDELNKKLDDLYQQENQLFADHKDAWDKVFGLMNKNTDGDAMNENYADFLASTVESNKDSFSEEEYETLNGFLIDQLERIPADDEQCVIDYEGYRFTILLVDNNTIQRVKIEKLS